MLVWVGEQENVEMPKLRVERSISHGRAGEINGQLYLGLPHKGGYRLTAILPPLGPLPLEFRL